MLPRVRDSTLWQSRNVINWKFGHFKVNVLNPIWHYIIICSIRYHFISVVKKSSFCGVYTLQTRFDTFSFSLKNFSKEITKCFEFTHVKRYLNFHKISSLKVFLLYKLFLIDALFVMVKQSPTIFSQQSTQIFVCHKIDCVGVDQIFR